MFSHELRYNYFLWIIIRGQSSLMVSGFWLNHHRHHSSQSSAAVEAQSRSAKGKPKKMIQTWRLASAKTTANIHHICPAVHMMAVSSCFSATRHWRVISLVASGPFCPERQGLLDTAMEKYVSKLQQGTSEVPTIPEETATPVLQCLCHPCREDGP